MSQQKTEPKNFKWVAKRILNSQKKLGTLKGLKVNVLSLSDSRKKYLKQAGLYAVAGISGGVLSGIAGYKKLNPKHKKAYIKGAIAGGLVATAASTAVKDAGKFVNKKQNVVIEAKYKYGTKVFKVYEISKSELEAGIDKVIYKNTVASLSRLKSAYTNSIKEDVTLEEFKLITLTESELESVMDWL